MARSLVAVALLAFAWLTAPPLAAQENERPPQVQQPERPLDPTTATALESLALRLAARRGERDEARARGDLEAVAAIEQELTALGLQFAELAARIDVQHFESPQQRQIELREELEQLVRPLLQALKDATEEPRRAAELRASIEQLEQRQRTAEEALAAVERTRDGLPADSAARAETQREIDRRWRPVIEALRSDLWVLRARLGTLTEHQQSTFDRIRGGVVNFVQSSGTTLFLAVIAFVAVFFGLRFAADRLLRRRRAERAFTLRVLEVAVQGLILLAAIAATLAVPYARDDWLLLAVCIVFLLGVGWVLARTLPQMFEQIRLVLNVGGVREGERILVDGLPYRVESLRFYSRLRNPELEGGELRVPIQYLIGRRSRRPAPDEPWFPCRSGDTVLLEDGTFGIVRAQTPEVVVVEQYGTERSYPTAKFLDQSPRNLSRGFAVRATARLDHAHQAAATAEIPERLRQELERGLAAEVGAGELRRVTVDFAAANPSSLDLHLIAEFAGTAARHYLRLERRLQALFVAACSANGWHIAVPQLTVGRRAVSTG